MTEMSTNDSNVMVAQSDGTYRTTYDSDQESLSTAVVLALSEVSEVDPADFQLYTYIDPDALDTLFSPINDTDKRHGRVELEALDYRISIHSSGEIVIQPSEPKTINSLDER